MKHLLWCSVLLALSGCDSSQAGPSKAFQAYEDKFHAQADAVIKAHHELLVKMGHMERGYGEDYLVLGTYGWDRAPGGSFGAYTFSQAAFDQAKRGWFGHFQVIEGSNELWPMDDWSNEEQRGTIRFDSTAIGLAVGGMSMSWVDKHGKYQHAWFTAKVVGIKDNGHTLIHDKRAPHQAEQWNMSIVPADWVGLCNCTMGPGIKP